MSNIWNLNWKDAIKAVALLILVAILLFIAEHGVSTGSPYADGLIVSVAAYLLKNFMSDNQGNPLGIGK